MPVESTAQLYARQLLPFNHGYPLWSPGEVAIGDVGFINDKGGFKRLFNAIKEPTEQDIPLPDGFTPLKFDPRILDFRSQYLTAGSVLAPESVTRSDFKYTMTGAAVGEDAGDVGNVLNGDQDQEGELNFERTFLERRCGKGALLYTKHASHRDSARNNKIAINYIKRNHDSWYRLARDNVDLSIKRDSIVLVQGTVKSSEYHAVVWTRKDHGENEGKGDNDNGQDSSAKQTIESKRGFDCGGTEYCLFIDRWKVKWRIFGFILKIEAGAGPDQLPRGDRDSDDTCRTKGSSSSDPLDAVLDYILENSSADIAIASDATLQELVGRQENTSMTADNVREYLRTHRTRIVVDDEKTGFLSNEIDDEINTQDTMAIAEGSMVNESLHPYKLPQSTSSTQHCARPSPSEGCSKVKRCHTRRLPITSRRCFGRSPRWMLWYPTHHRITPTSRILA